MNENTMEENTMNENTMEENTMNENKTNKVKYYEYYCGVKVSNYGLANGFVDYGTLARTFNCVLNNDIISTAAAHGMFFEQESGYIDNEEEIDSINEKIDELENRIEELRDEEEIDSINEKIEELKNRIDELRDEEENVPDIYQWFIVDDNGAERLKGANEIVYHCEELDMYLWGITHCGTCWDYVLTNIPLVKKEA